MMNQRVRRHRFICLHKQRALVWKYITNLKRARVSLPKLTAAKMNATVLHLKTENANWNSFQDSMPPSALIRPKNNLFAIRMDVCFISILLNAVS